VLYIYNIYRLRTTCWKVPTGRHGGAEISARFLGIFHDYFAESKSGAPSATTFGTGASEQPEISNRRGPTGTIEGRWLDATRALDAGGANAVSKLDFGRAERGRHTVSKVLIA
jgi:hypothetical protein